MYQPNLSDRRVQKRMRMAFSYTVAVVGVNPKDLYHKHIHEAYGRLSNPLSAWMKRHLLTEHQSNWNMHTGKTKTYCMNAQGVTQIAEYLGYPGFEYNSSSQISYNKQVELFYKSYALEYFQNKYGRELQSGDFDYNFSSNRYWHGIQSMRRDTRDQLLLSNGYLHQYDIQTAAPVLLYQLWQARNHFVGDLVKLDTLKDYIDNKAQVRHQVMTETGLTYDQTKTIINAITNGAVIAASKFRQIYQELDCDTLKIQKLKDCKWIQDYQTDIRNLWKGIGQGNTPDGQTKWQIYFHLEFQVMRVIYDYLEDNNIRSFRLHDCFVSETPVDIQEIQKDIYKRTNKEINFDYKRYQ